MLKISTYALTVLFTTFMISLCLTASAGVESSMTGNVTDPDGVAVSGAKVQLRSIDGKLLKETKTSQTGTFDFFPVDFGNYQLAIEATGLTTYRATTAVTSASPAQIDVHLQRPVDGVSADVSADVSGGKEYIINVKEKRNLIQSTSSGSKTDITKEEIKTLPGGDNISLPKLLASTTPGVIQGPFGQMFIRGNHANIQYQIDGVQLPDSMSGTFGDAFSPRNIDHMEVITGGIPAEYGERMAAVMNIVTKSGPEAPTGSAEINYGFGAYNTFNPQLNYGGSDESGKLRYLFSVNYMQTDRGLDTPQPASYDDQSHGGRDNVHDIGTGNDQFGRIDYILDDQNKFTVNLFNSVRAYQIPNFPSTFQPGDPYFSVNSPYTDPFGNVAQELWLPPSAANSQSEQNSYLELVWKRTFSEHSFLQVAPYYKRSALKFVSDATSDLPPVATVPTGGTNPSAPSAFNMDRSVDNFGLKADYTLRYNEQSLIKTGFQIQQSNGAGSFAVQQTSITSPALSFGTPDHGTIEAVYAQDSYSIAKPLTLNAGIRYTATQFNTDGLSSQDGLVQPRIGLEYVATDSTKLHLFYGKLFQPAPFEDLREAFAATSNTPVSHYDVKAEKDDFYEIGVAQQVGDTHLARLNYYYKDAVNMLDDAQLLSTSIAQPYNFSHGYATGVEFSWTGFFASKWSDFFNYAYEDAKGQGVSGGTFAQTTDPNAPYQYLDHVQLHTANAGLTYKENNYWTTLEGIYGSGLRTGNNNSASLPSHATFDLTVGYEFHDQDWWSKWRVSADIINIFDDSYPITVANGFNGNHYAAGREFFIRLAKEL